MRTFVLVMNIDLVDEAEVEHGTLKQLIADIEDMGLEDELFDAKVKVLGEDVKHHVKEEEGEIFPAVKKAGLDLDQLGQELMERKTELQGDADLGSERKRTPQQSGIFRLQARDERSH